MLFDFWSVRKAPALFPLSYDIKVVVNIHFYGKGQLQIFKNFVRYVFSTVEAKRFRNTINEGTVFFAILSKKQAQYVTWYHIFRTIVQMQWSYRTNCSDRSFPRSSNCISVNSFKAHGRVQNAQTIISSKICDEHDESASKAFRYLTYQSLRKTEINSGIPHRLIWRILWKCFILLRTFWILFKHLYIASIKRSSATSTEPFKVGKRIHYSFVAIFSQPLAFLSEREVERTQC